MGQVQSPSKSCARPSSSMFHNNLAEKIKDSKFKKHLSSHGFVSKSRFREIIDSNYTKSYRSELSSLSDFNIKLSGELDPKRKK